MLLFQYFSSSCRSVFSLFVLYCSSSIIMVPDYYIGRFEGHYPEQVDIPGLLRRVRELEKKLEVATVTSPIIGRKNPSEKVLGGWVEVVKRKPGSRGGAGKRLSSSINKPVEEVRLMNRFAVLTEEIPPKQEHVDRNVIIIGDEIVEKLDRAICSKDQKKRVRVCFPGAKIEDVFERVESCMKGEGPNPVVFVCAGGNNIREKRSEKLLAQYKDTLMKIKENGGTPMGCGILPRKEGEMWLSRAISFNESMKKYCKEKGIAFVDIWSEFCGKREMYQDNIRPSVTGVRLLARSMEEKLYFLGENKKRQPK